MAQVEPTHWADIQAKVFGRWMNTHLKQRGLRVEDLTKDVKDGLLLLNLLDIISDKSPGRWNKHPIIYMQKLENCNIAVKFVQDAGIKLVNISGDDIASGREKLILGLVWSIILRWEISAHGDNASDAKNELLEWVRSKISPPYTINNFRKDWNDGRAICALINAICPDSDPGHWDRDPKNNVENARVGIDNAFNLLGVDRIILANEMCNPKVDEHSMMTYINEIRQASENKATDASRCSAYGPGLVEAIVGKETSFTVVNPSGHGNLQVTADGVTFVEQKVDKNTSTFTYTAASPGTANIHVALSGENIPGSVFAVPVLAELSLGGEGKIRVFYSTTSAKRATTRPLQELLESKGVHLREDFENWIPVDTVEREDRLKIFEKAGTRELPQVWIDDVLVGNSEATFEADKSGKLDKMLQIEKYQHLVKKAREEQAKRKEQEAAKTKARAQATKSANAVQADVSFETTEDPILAALRAKKK